ncbi:hypothetical protein HTIA_1913 [Halorhabdus tiamatea SARL4B]|uniref:Uncharacterized protein n=1 Tax=Halorhabdus tiamatea SARL4B TaxID=1033806 RepID=S6CUT4_9EURY|nr:hypothetical protein HTIA_1913 [Halorhabdus tiamatea SARL4B]
MITHLDVLVDDVDPDSLLDVPELGARFVAVYLDDLSRDS